MNEQEQQLQEIELSIEEAKKHIQMADALDRLYKNPDFKMIFLDGYFLHEASRTVLLKADPNMQEKREQKNVDGIIMGIGMLRQYFAKVFHMGTMSEKAIEDSEETRQEILQEQLLEESIQ